MFNFSIFTGKFLVEVSFLIKNFKAILLKRDSSTGVFCEYCGIFKKTCFEEHLEAAASIRCYFEIINQNQSDFCATHFFKVLATEQKYEINLKDCKSKSKKRKTKYLEFSYLYSVYVMFYYKIPCIFFKILRENLCFLNLY